jgi:DUF4097 and DUF4098 domain-containing protein YvlB
LQPDKTYRILFFEMRFSPSIVTTVLAALLICGTSAHAQKSKDKDKVRNEGAAQLIQQTATTTATVNVMLTTGAGKITVRGWERNEVQAATKQAGAKIVLRKTGAADASAPAARIEVLVSERDESEETNDDSSDVNSNMTLDVPRGATVFLKTEDGDIDVEDVAEVHVESSGGRIDLRRILKATEAASVGGDVTLEDASGRARLSSIGGVVEVKNMRALDANDFLKAKTASGDILLDRVGPAHVEASTITGEVKMMGVLARGGSYTFTTTTGDVTLELPADSSFKLNARVSERGEIDTEFPLAYKGPSSSAVMQGHLSGTYGSGDATINLISISGTIRLRKK